jgi:hypothetical protein
LTSGLSVISSSFALSMLVTNQTRPSPVESAIAIGLERSSCPRCVTSMAVSKVFRISVNCFMSFSFMGSTSGGRKIRES